MTTFGRIILFSYSKKSFKREYTSNDNLQNIFLQDNEKIYRLRYYTKENKLIISTYKDEFKAWRLILVGFWEKEQEHMNRSSSKVWKRAEHSHIPDEDISEEISEKSSVLTDFGYGDSPINIRQSPENEN